MAAVWDVNPTLLELLEHTIWDQTNTGTYFVWKQIDDTMI